MTTFKSNATILTLSPLGEKLVLWITDASKNIHHDDIPILQDRENRSIGDHEGCGHCTILRISPTYRALVCNDCHLRIPIPLEIVTVGQLRTFLEKQTSERLPIIRAFDQK